MDWQHFFIRANDVLTAGVSATAFALVLYLFFYNRRSKVARVILWFVGMRHCCLFDGHPFNQ